MKLTKEQLDAVGHVSGDLQLIACAGSGKTEVVALRIANLLAPDQGGVA
jgi:DNA helicase-2/ATP-dependent DNA helicase PcrA